MTKAKDVKYVPLSKDGDETYQDMVDQLNKDIGEAISIAEGLLDMVTHGDFSNGVEHQGIDEGRVMAGRFYDQSADRLDKLKEKYNG